MTNWVGKGLSWLGHQLFGSGTDDFHFANFGQTLGAAAKEHLGNASNTFDHYMSAPTYGLPYLSILQGDPYGTFLSYAVPISGQVALGLASGGLSLEGEAAGEGFVSLLGGGCFVAGTPVQMADGTTKPIEQVREGDVVLSRDQSAGATGAIEGKHVLRAYHLQVSHTVLLTLSSGEVLETTENHPFFVYGAGWVKAGQLSIGNLLVPRAGPTPSAVTVTGIERAAGPPTVCEFTASAAHCYCAKAKSRSAHRHRRVSGQPKTNPLSAF